MSDAPPPPAGPPGLADDPRVDVEVTLEYAARTHLLMLPMGAVAIAVGLFNVMAGDPGTELALSGWAALLVGAVVLAMVLYRLVVPAPPILELSPRGLIYRNISRNIVPWDAIEAVDQRDHTVSFRRDLVTYAGTTVVWVTRSFYERVLYQRSLFWRGPFWENNFIEEDARIGMVIVPDLLAVPANEIQAEVRARWTAFRDRRSDTVVPATGRVARRTARRLRTGSVLRQAPMGVALTALSVIALGVLVAHLAGLWHTDLFGSDERSRARAWNTEWADRQAALDRQIEENRAATERLRREIDDHWKRFDEERAAAERRARELRAQHERQAAARPREPAPPRDAPAAVAGHRAAVLWLSVAPDGVRFASASGDNTVKLWTTKAATAQRDVAAHKAIVRSVHVLPDGGHALSGSDDGEVALRRLADGERLHLFDTADQGELNALAVSPDGRRAVSVHGGGAIVVMDVAARTRLRVLNAGGMTQQAVAVSPDGRRALTGGSDGVPRLWDIEAGALLRSFEAHQGPVYGVAFTPDGWRGVSGGGDAVLRLWDLDSGRLVRSFEGHTRSVYAVAIAADGLRALTGSIDGTARLWDLATGAEIRRITGHRGPVYAVALAGDGLVLTGGDDRTIRVWRPDGVEQMRFFGAVD